MSGRHLAHVAAEHLALARQEPTKRARVLRLAELGYGPAAIGRALGLSPSGVRWHLQAHAEGRRAMVEEVLPDGAEFLYDAATRTGFDQGSLANVLRWHGATIHRADAWRARMWAMRSDIDAAVAAWMDSETVQAASERLGVSAFALRSWLIEAGHERPARHQHWRLPSATIDAVVAERRAGGAS